MTRLSQIFLLLTITTACGCAQAEVSTPPPNIILVIVDDLGRQDVGAYGGEFYDTPNLDRLAANGVRFENAYAAHPRCLPSRLGIMSGRYPASYGIPGFQDREEGKHALPLSTTTFAEVLRDAGYRTGYIGKWHLGKEGGEPNHNGFDVSIMAGAAGAPPSYFLPYEQRRQRSDSKGFVEYSGGEPGEYLTDRLTDEALTFIDDSKDDPFLLVLAHYAVHTPIEAPEDLIKKYEKKLEKTGLPGKWDADIVTDSTGEVKTVQNHPVYAGMVESVDQNVGRLVQKLEDENLSENTVVIITSDHGGLSSRGLGNKRELATSNLPYRHGKGWLYDGGIRVPLIASWPAGIEGGLVSEVQTTGVDHYATFLELAGLPVRPEVHSDAVSYRAALDGEFYERKPMFWHSSLGRPTQTGDTRSSAVIDGDWKLIQWYSLETEEIIRVELFNLSDDPGEQHDLSQLEVERFQILEKALNDWKLSVNARLGEFKPGGT